MPRKSRYVQAEEIGRRFGRLVVRDFETMKKVNCICDCGNATCVSFYQLLRGNTSSCGCLEIENRIRHGHNTQAGKSPEYSVWDGMMQRCYNPNQKNYRLYGGRGIKVTLRWHTFKNFLLDMGARPSGLTLDRIDGNGDYNKENCRWISQKEQTWNMRTNHMITIKGQSKCIGAWVAEYGINRNTAVKRLRLGWPPEEAFSRPVLTASLKQENYVK